MLLKQFHEMLTQSMSSTTGFAPVKRGTLARRQGNDHPDLPLDFFDRTSGVVSSAFDPLAASSSCAIGRASASDEIKSLFD